MHRGTTSHLPVRLFTCVPPPTTTSTLPPASHLGLWPKYLPLLENKNSETLRCCYNPGANQGGLGWSDILLTVCARVIQSGTKKKHLRNVIIQIHVFFISSALVQITTLLQPPRLHIKLIINSSNCYTNSHVIGGFTQSSRPNMLL